ncbi:MAG: hypothetical protein ACHQUB_03000 [Candidatus Saccharimonadia bacterium]
MARKLPDAIVTPDDVLLLALEIGQVADLQREAAMRKSSKTPDLEISPQLLEWLDIKPGGALPSATELDKSKLEAETIRQSAPTATITLAALPAHKFKSELVSWFRSEIHPETLVVFVLNREIAGGLAIRFGSQIFDWSFRKLLLTNQQAMSKVLKDV